MTRTSKLKGPDLNRRDALRRLGLAVGAAYVAPVILSLSDARASEGSSGGGGGGGGGGSGGGGGASGGGDSGGSGGASSVESEASGASMASSPSSPGSDGEDEFSGDPTPAGENLTSEEELLLIRNGWQKAGN